MGCDEDKWNPAMTGWGGTIRPRDTVGPSSLPLSPAPSRVGAVSLAPPQASRGPVTKRTVTGEPAVPWPALPHNLLLLNLIKLKTTFYNFSGLFLKHIISCSMTVMKALSLLILSPSASSVGLGRTTDFVDLRTSSRGFRESWIPCLNNEVNIIKIK